jgi:hypothetical protein
VTTWLYHRQQLAFLQLADRAVGGAAVDAGVVGDGGVAGFGDKDLRTRRRETLESACFSAIATVQHTLIPVPARCV